MNRIDELLEKYYAGETLLCEEEELRIYFESEEVEDCHLSQKPIFVFFSGKREELTEEKVSIAVAKKQTRAISLGLFYRVGIAASALLVLSLGIRTLYNQNSLSPEKSIVYMDGKRITNRQMMDEQIIKSINAATASDETILNSQVDMLEDFLN